MSDLNKHPECVKVQVRVKRPGRFKAGSEVDSSAVNLIIEVESEGDLQSLWIQQEKGESEDFKLQVSIGKTSCKGD